MKKFGFNMFNILLLGLLCVLLMTMVINSCGHKDVPLTPLSAEQQELITKLQTATRGDIIVISGQQDYMSGIYLVLWASEYENHSWQICIRPMQNGFMTDILAVDYLARMDISFFKTDKPEWAQILKYYLSTDPDSLTQ